MAEKTKTQTERSPTLIEVVKVSPQILLWLVVLIGLWVFHPVIGQLIGRATKVGIGPISIEAVQQKLKNLTISPNLSALMTKEQVAHVTKRFNEATDGSPNVNILWVDDTPINNRTVIGIFEAMGFHVYVARSYAEGIARFDERPFNVVISDYNEERDPDQIEAKKTGRADWGVGALIAEHVGKSCGARTIIFSAGWDPGQSTPPYAVVETNNRYVLLDATANLIEKPIEPDCL